MRGLVWGLVGAVVVSLVFAGGASAAVTGLELRTDSGALDTTAAKSATAFCPAGKQVTGAAGIKTHEAFGEVRLVAARPAPDLKSVVSTFREDETGFAGSWQPFAHALCVSSLTGMQRVAATSASTSAAKSVTATCPTGKRLIGLGAETAGGNQVVLDVMRPNPGLTAAVVAAREDQTGFAGNWTVSAYAVCAVAPQGLQRVSAAGQVSAGGPDIVADCPAGKGLLGVGGEASGGSGQVGIETSALPGTGEPTRGIGRGFEDQDGYAPAWTMTAYAICANSAVLAVAQSSTNSDDSRFGEVNCPGGKQATGLGGEVTGGVGEVWLQDLDFFDPFAAGAISAWEDQTGTLRNWFIRTYAICATPLPGLERVSAVSADDSNADKSVTMSCPAGKRVVGGAGLVGGDDGEVVLEDVAPNPALTSVRARGSEDQAQTLATWAVEAIAKCANPPPGLQLVTAASEPGSEEFTTVTATCPTGKNLIGTGGEISAGLGEVMLDDLRPNASLTNVTVTAAEDETGFDLDWTVSAHAICANP